MGRRGRAWQAAAWVVSWARWIGRRKRVSWRGLFSGWVELEGRLGLDEVAVFVVELWSLREVVAVEVVESTCSFGSDMLVWVMGT